MLQPEPPIVRVYPRLSQWRLQSCRALFPIQMADLPRRRDRPQRARHHFVRIRQIDRTPASTGHNQARHESHH